VTFLVRYIAESDEELQTILDAPPIAYLTVVSGGRLSQSWPLRGEVQLGREKSNTLVVSDQKISRHHASLTPVDTTFIISDLGSANGTYVNGVLITQPVRLKDNDRVGVGDTTFLFTLTQPAPEMLERPLPPTPSPRLTPVAATPSSIPLWILIGCMVLMIMALIFIVAMLLGLFLGRAQLIGLSPGVTGQLVNFLAGILFELA
jgi:pSer/pThr/pTyr-binding forkhead associated (FHA) protein